ncbi:SRPBCC domain-containing protein [Arthrobacter roseus]|uniref:SRPBCC domain-containing protein n=1 Tax=Arthrobacter roseus TaxID=136274 RepID=UPI001964484D|nr:SRPBCC domain-containing protein [Arthrobacter roseus]MBM7847711.1 hypothetical protein [Arthrobacter roseus]
MSDLFSHAEPDRIRNATNAMRGTAADDAATGAPEATTAMVVVPAARERAWEGFTDNVHLWWPAENTHFGAPTHAELTETSMGEENDAGDEHEWACVVRTDQQREIELSWTLGWDKSSPSRVRVTFDDNSLDGSAVGTKVTVVHDDWGSGPEGEKQAKAFNGWSSALSSYARFMGSDPSGGKH